LPEVTIEEDESPSPSKRQKLSAATTTAAAAAAPIEAKKPKRPSVPRTTISKSDWAIAAAEAKATLVEKTETIKRMERMERVQEQEITRLRTAIETQRTALIEEAKRGRDNQLADFTSQINALRFDLKSRITTLEADLKLEREKNAKFLLDQIQLAQAQAQTARESAAAESKDHLNTYKKAVFSTQYSGAWNKCRAILPDDLVLQIEAPPPNSTMSDTQVKASIAGYLQKLGKKIDRNALGLVRHNKTQNRNAQEELQKKLQLTVLPPEEASLCRADLARSATVAALLDETERQITTLVRA
jgi:hypothetical protein